MNTGKQLVRLLNRQHENWPRLKKQIASTTFKGLTIHTYVGMDNRSVRTNKNVREIQEVVRKH